jgi:hypothetical protein
MKYITFYNVRDFPIASEIRDISVSQIGFKVFIEGFYIWTCGSISLEVYDSEVNE